MKLKLSEKQFREARADALVSFAQNNCAYPISFNDILSEMYAFPMCWKREVTEQAVKDLVDQGRACVITSEEPGDLLVIIPEIAGPDQDEATRYVAAAAEGAVSVGVN